MEKESQKRERQGERQKGEGSFYIWIENGEMGERQGSWQVLFHNSGGYNSNNPSSYKSMSFSPLSKSVTLLFLLSSTVLSPRL